MKLTIAVVDGMGGGIGTEVVAQLRRELPQEVTIIALGTNAVATDRMVQAKANRGATGANAVRVSINNADYIIGPIGIVLPNGLMGEVTTEIAEAVMGAPGEKLLLPIHQPHFEVVGLEDRPIKELIRLTISSIKKREKLLT